MEFPTPMRGAFSIATGDQRGKDAVVRGSASVSSDGRHWTRVVAVRDGKASFRTDRGIRFVRLAVEADQRSPLVVREIELR